MLAARFGLIAGAINDLDGANDEDLPGVAGFEECIALAERDLRLIDFNDPFERFDSDRSSIAATFVSAAMRSCR